MIIDDGKKQHPNSTPEVKTEKQEATVPVVAASAPAAVEADPLAGVSRQDLTALIGLLAQQAARAAKKDAEQDARIEQRRKHYEETRSDDERTNLVRQASCRHLKGGKTRRKTNVIDYVVYAHTFITGETYIKCQACRMKWRPTDTDAFVVRNGKVYKNHTKIGWQKALEMCANSSNQKSSSEIPPENMHKVVREFREVPELVDVDTNPVGEAEGELATV